MSINVVIISGNLTRDPDLRHTNSGTAILSFGVAVNDRMKDRDGSWVDRPNFVDVTVFGRRAEALSRFLSKGAKVALSGKLRYSSWERDGQKRSKLEVIAEEIEFLSRDGDVARTAAPQARVQAPPEQPTEGIYEDDIPF